MIISLRGVLESKVAGTVVVDVEGVGFQVFIPMSTFQSLPEPGREVKLYTHLVVRDDAFELFGFISPEEHEIFLLLLSVSDVGPRTALNILSGIGPQEIKQAIVRKNFAVLTSIPRVGRKIAEKIVVELADKIEKMSPESAGFANAPSGGKMDDAVDALVALGYKRPAVWQALRQAGEKITDGMAVQDIIKLTLKYL
jgi:Holliday junction DNA helicase RuvA